VLRHGFGHDIYATAREGYLRIAFHAWHTQRDVDRILTWLEEVRP